MGVVKEKLRSNNKDGSYQRFFGEKTDYSK